MVVRAVLAVVLLVALGGCADPASTGTAGGAPSPSTSTSPGTSPDVATADPAACPVSGVRVLPGFVDAATGFRAVTLTLTSCGDEAFEVEGYPVVELLDADGAVLDVVEERGSTSFPDPGPTPLVLQPGDEATSVMSWRNTVTDGVPVEAQQVRLAAADGMEPQTSELFVDLGTTGTYALTAWAAAVPG